MSRLEAFCRLARVGHRLARVNRRLARLQSQVAGGAL